MSEVGASMDSVLVERSPDIVIVIDADGTVRSINPAATLLTGWPAEQTVGRSVLELIHPDDLERTAFDLSLYATGSAEPGYSTYRVRCSDGTYRSFEVTGSEVATDDATLLALYCRPDDRAAAAVLDGLLRGTSTADTLRPVCDAFNWKQHGSRVAISWLEDDGMHAVSTKLPDALAGGDPDGDSPWGRCWREATPQRSIDLVPLDDARRALAVEQGLGAYWIEPVLDDESDVCALITLWMRAGGPVPELHSSGMSWAKDHTELTLRWARQRRQLQDAAARDTLTGLANRKAFFDALTASSAGGAVLYCDLDRFKPVNDDLGHLAGDELLRAVAGRIKACVRSADVVARLGGDEFAVLCRGMPAVRAVELAQRIQQAVVEPYRVNGALATVGISIGVAHGDDDLGEAVLELADRALRRAKSAGGSAVAGPDDAS
jgi:diguanylate cyclase (GGDEF)-like protein/PAS domain S-box-containing protein